MLRLLAIPWFLKWLASSTDMKEEPRSECMNSGIPHKENTTSKHLITVSVEIFGQGMANGKREYSSITVNKYLFFDVDGKGALNSMLNCFIGRFGLIRLLF